MYSVGLQKLVPEEVAELDRQYCLLQLMLVRGNSIWSLLCSVYVFVEVTDGVNFVLGIQRSDIVAKCRLNLHHC